MTLTAEPLPLRLRTPFRIAHGVSAERTNVLVRLGDGIGEGALPPYYPTSLDEALNALNTLDLEAWQGDAPLAPEHLLDRLPALPAPARAALDLALHDHWARTLGQPLYRLWGLDPAQTPPSSLTLSIPEDDDALRQQARDRAHLPTLKLKLGTGDLERDEALVRIAREEVGADVQLGVDANSAWNVEQAAQIIPRLAAYNLLYVEQPIGAGDIRDWHRLRDRLPASGMPPLIADESVQGASSIFPLAGGADGINIKLTKAGGLREARRMIAVARTLGMQVMLGCMVESSAGVTAAAHLAPLADFVDLDGHLDVMGDPFEGVRWENGRLSLPERPGLGLHS